MRKDKKPFSFMNIGASSLLVVFLGLCLTTFSILSLSGAKSDYSLSKKLSDHRTAYYAASSKAEAVAGNIDQLLCQTYEDAGFLTDPYFAALKDVFKEYQAEELPVSLTEDKNTLILSYVVPVDEDQILAVKLEITDPALQDTYYKILAWETDSTAEWQESQTLQLIPVQ